MHWDTREQRQHGLPSSGLSALNPTRWKASQPLQGAAQGPGAGTRCGRGAPGAALTQHGDGGVDLLRRVGVELAEVPALVGDGDVGQGHAQLAVGEVHQLEAAVLERCGARTRSGHRTAEPRAGTNSRGSQTSAPRVPTAPHPAPDLTAGPIQYFCSQTITKNQHEQITEHSIESLGWFYYQVAQGHTGEMVIVRTHFYTAPFPTVHSQWTA